MKSLLTKPSNVLPFYTSSSQQREVFFKKTKAQARNKRRAKRMKIKRDQTRKTVHERLDTKHVKMRLGKSAAKNTRKRPHTPSTDMVSDEDAPYNPRTVSPRSTSMLERNYRISQRNFNKKTNRVKIREEEENDPEEHTNSENKEVEEQDIKVSKNKKYQCK